MKHSPLCTRDDGKEVMFTAMDGATKLRFVASSALLDDVCGAGANDTKRKDWVKANLPAILEMRRSGSALAPLDRITIEEIS